MPAIIGLNHLFIDQGSLTGPGYYAVELAEHMLRLAASTKSDFRFKIFVQRGTAHHYSDNARLCLVEMPNGRGRYGRVFLEQLLLPFVAHRHGIDLIFSPAFVSPIIGPRLKAATFHDMYYRVFPEAVEPKQRFYWRVMIPLTSRVCDLLMTVSENSKHDIETYLPAARGKVIVTPNGNRFTALPEVQIGEEGLHSRSFILMVANLTANKNVTRVVEALALLRSSGRDLDFLHIGSDLNGELARAVAVHNLGTHVRALGKVDDITLIKAARSCLCMVVPSLYEGFGMPAIEAQALGAPLVCSNRSSLPEVAKGVALMFDPEDAPALAGCIATVMDDLNLRSEMQRRGVQNAQNYSWTRTARLTLDAFGRLLGASGAPQVQSCSRRPDNA